jgi:oxygen-dependent protoporphyrinogen oxidase
MWRGRFSTMAKRIVIVGGGITGLSAAHAAVLRARAVGQEVAQEVGVTVVERSHRFGGNLITERENGFVLDAGADSWVASKPEATALARELGLERALIGTNEANRRYYVAWDNRLHPVPEGLVLGVPTRVGPLARSRLFSWRGKLRMAIEPFIPARRFAADDDESIADFARRRLGVEAAERLLCPLLGGISAGDASDVSMRAAFPQLVAMESEYGSLARGMRAAARMRNTRRADDADGADGAAGSTFLSLTGGVEELVHALVARLGEDGATLRTGAAADVLVRDASGWRLTLAGGESIFADAVLLAVPARVAATILRPVDAELGRLLASVPFSSSTTLFLGYRREDVGHPLDGVGFVAPRTPGRSVLASTWVSSKWSGRAPEGHVLLRVFFGGPPAHESEQRDERALSNIARVELRSLMGLDAEPLFTRAFRFDAARAQMRVGHLAMMRAVRERLARAAAGVRIAGEGYGGAGIPDCIRQGEEAGRAMVDGPHR